MSPSICFPSIVSKLSLVVLLLSAISFPSCSSVRATQIPCMHSAKQKLCSLFTKEFALTTKEESDVKEQNQKEVEEVEEEELDPEDLEVFYPTRQWQTVRPGQALPAGLHVQLNLQTGERLAKLPDNDNEKRDAKDPSKNKSNMEEREMMYAILSSLEKARDKDMILIFALSHIENVHLDILFALSKLQQKRADYRLGPIEIDPSSFTTQELKKALAKMKESVKAEDMLEQKAHQEDVRRRFRPIEKLKEEFRELNVLLETDFEIMSKLINRFNRTTSTLEEKIAALYDLEYYVHQVDNAKDLLSLGGLRLLINGLNSTEPLLKEYTSFVLGAALSSNPRVQVAALDGGALQKLLVVLATDQSLVVKKKALFALSSMLRNFPYAQQQFLRLGGLQILRDLCTEKGMETLHVRIVTLLYDLIIEKLLLKESEGQDDHMEERTQQYHQVNLVPAIVEQGWCTIISNLLKRPQHDTREKVLKTVDVLLAFCRENYKGDHNLNHTLSLLRQEYEELAAEEQKEGDGDGYFKELLGSINSIAQQLK